MVFGADQAYQIKMTDPSAACCKGKPIHMHGPEAELKGEFQEFDGLKTYVVGPPTATSALLVIYDIFGFWTQTLHGMDTLSLTATSSSPAGLKLFAPDWFDGAEADISYWPADTDDKLKYIKGYFATHADPGKTLKRMVSVMEAIRGREEYKGIERWGIAGYCWGGKLFDGVKIVTLASQEGTIFKAGAQTHPSLVEPEDAKLVTIPQIVLPSMDEDPEVRITQLLAWTLGRDRLLIHRV
ncbi:hypothetical protein ACMFMF_005835 [Clarireedia jacksonii]